MDLRARAPRRTGRAVRAASVAKTSRVAQFRATSSACTTASARVHRHPDPSITSGACDFVYGGYAWIKLLRMAKRIRSLKLRKSIFPVMWLQVAFHRACADADHRGG